MVAMLSKWSHAHWSGSRCHPILWKLPDLSGKAGCLREVSGPKQAYLSAACGAFDEGEGGLTRRARTGDGDGDALARGVIEQ